MNVASMSRVALNIRVFAASPEDISKLTMHCKLPVVINFNVKRMKYIKLLSRGYRNVLQTFCTVRHMNMVKHSTDLFQTNGYSAFSTQTQCFLQQKSKGLPQNNNKQIKVLYDGQCPLCVAEINIMKRLDLKKKTVNFVDITVGEYNPEDHLGITFTQAMGKMHVIDTKNNIYDSMEAMKMMYSSVGLRGLSTFLSIPVIQTLADRFYVWFAINRYRLAGRSREECESGRCQITNKSKS